MKKQTKLGLVLAAAAVISVSVASLVSARGWVQNGADWYYVDNAGEYVTETIQSSGNAKFYLGEDGTMQRDYFLEEYNNNAYYFGQNGAMVTNTWVAIESSRVENQEDYVPDNYWYYFQASGKAMKAASGNIKKTTIDGKKYAFNEYGQMLTGWIQEGKVVADDEENPFKDATYYAGGDNDGVLRSGWLTYYDGFDGDEYQSDYTNLYFYFNTSNNEKYANRIKKINGRSYAFDDYGVMNSGWDVYDNLTNLNEGRVSYFSGEDDGHQVKKGWVYAVPAERLDQKAYDDDEEKYMYFNASGEILRDQFKRINGKYYVFSRTGIMKTGLVIWAPNTVQQGTGTNADYYRYINTLDLDWQTGEELSKKGIMRYDDGQDTYFWVDMDGMTYRTAATTWADNLSEDEQVKLHYFGSDGARKTGSNSVEFSDDTYVLNTNSNGDKGSGIFAKKYYSLGVQLKASQDIRYGIFNIKEPNVYPSGEGPSTLDAAGDVKYPGDPLAAQADKNGGSVDDYAGWRANLDAGNYLVLNTGGTKVKGNQSAKKDADGNYWLINRTGDTLKGIWSVNVKANSSFNTSLKTRAIVPNYADEAILETLADTTGGIDYVTIASLSQFYNITDNTLDEWLSEEVMEDANPGSTTSWQWRVMQNGRQFYLQLRYSRTGFGFQSDVNDQSNKWIPFGILDNSKKSCSASAVMKDDGTNLGWPTNYYAYEVAPTNDYFLNCYWING